MKFCCLGYKYFLFSWILVFSNDSFAQTQNCGQDVSLFSSATGEQLVYSYFCKERSVGQGRTDREALEDLKIDLSKNLQKACTFPFQLSGVSLKGTKKLIQSKGFGAFKTVFIEAKVVVKCSSPQIIYSIDISNIAIWLDGALSGFLNLVYQQIVERLTQAPSF